jgi:DNA-binding MarR family transcriptional regulator
VLRLGYTFNVVLSFTPEARAANAADAPDPPDTLLVANERQTLAEDVLDELAGWGPREFVGQLQSWHRGALSLVQLSVLAVLETQGPLPMSRLAETLDVSDASATGIVDRIERRGYVERRHATADRRVVLVVLTELGQDVFHELQQNRRRRLALAGEQLSDDELAGLLTGLRAMRAAVGRLHAERENRTAEQGADPIDGAAGAEDLRARSVPGSTTPGGAR